MTQESTTRRVRVTPKPGFVVKTTTTAPGFYAPPTAQGRVPVPPALKVFVNVAYDPAVPAPPTEDTAVLPGDTYVVPVIVSDGRGDVDKAGKPSLVFDAILSPALKPRITTDPAFRAFVLEIILSHIESPPHPPGAAPPRALSLSRALATPNIRSKGALAPRDVAVPVFGQVAIPAISEIGTISEMATPPPGKSTPLIEELPPAPDADLDPHAATPGDAQRTTPRWRWVQKALEVDLPDLTHTSHAHTTLLLSPDILTLRTPTHFLQVPLTDIDVAHARAEWRVREGRVVVYTT